jgi:hypothetical protein
VTLVRRTHESGLVLAEHAQDEAGLARALRQIDSRLTLQFRPPYYVVVCQVNDHYAPVIATWMDIYGHPLPLSSGLLEKVQAARLGARNQPLSVDEHNAQRLADIESDRERMYEALRDDHRPTIERGRTTVTMATTKKPRYWRRENAAPRSGIQQP